MSDSPVVMLVVEDNPADVVFFQEAVRMAALPAQLHVVDNGADALDFLCQQGQFADAPRPDVVVLDVNLPVKSGVEVMHDMRADDSLRQIPIAILTTSSCEAHLVNRYTPGRCEYFTKTPDFAKLSAIVTNIHNMGLKFGKTGTHSRPSRHASSDSPR